MQTGLLTKLLTGVLIKEKNAEVGFFVNVRFLQFSTVYVLCYPPFYQVNHQESQINSHLCNYKKHLFEILM